MHVPFTKADPICLVADCCRRWVEEQDCPARDAAIGHTSHQYLEPEHPYVAVPYQLQREGRGLHTHVPSFRISVLDLWAVSNAEVHIPRDGLDPTRCIIPIRGLQKSLPLLCSKNPTRSNSARFWRQTNELLNDLCAISGVPVQEDWLGSLALRYVRILGVLWYSPRSLCCLLFCFYLLYESCSETQTES